MSYWERVKSALGVEPEKVEPDAPQIEFTPDELREMRDPTTAVGRMLNPQLLDGESPRTSGAAELFYFGKDPTALHRTFLDPKKERYNNYQDAMAATTDAYLKDAEKRGVVSSNDDRITKNYKIINQIKKDKGLENVQIHESVRSPGAGGSFYPENNTITTSDQINPFHYIDDNALDYDGIGLLEAIQNAVSKAKNSTPYPKKSISKQKQEQERNLNQHLATIVHELRHAEDHKTDPKREQNYAGHFKDAPLFGGGEDDSGKIQDIQAAALQRLMNMGTKRDK